MCLGYFNSLSAALEMKARTRSVNEKITYAAEVRLFSQTLDLCSPSVLQMQSVLRQLLTEVIKSILGKISLAHMCYLDFWTPYGTHHYCPHRC